MQITCFSRGPEVHFLNQNQGDNCDEAIAKDFIVVKSIVGVMVVDEPIALGGPLGPLEGPSRPLGGPIRDLRGPNWAP